MIVKIWSLEEALRRHHSSDAGPGVFSAAMSPYDARFPYIRDVIRKKSATAAYVPVTLGYLDPRQADGLLGRTHSATLDAVRVFQTRNGLKPDRDLGGAHSLTRAALRRLTAELQRAP